MLVLRKKKLFLKLEEVYFCEDYMKYSTDADIVLFYQSKKEYLPGHPKHTLHIDLTKDKDQLFKQLEIRTRQYINKAKRTGLMYFFNDSPSFEDLEDFSKFYNEFARLKGIPTVDPRKFLNFRAVNSFVITCIKDSDGSTLCYHAYIVDGCRTRSLYSASHFRSSNSSEYRNMIGCANKYLHWLDMLAFKEKGLSIYDFGGMALKDDEVLKGIDRFKLGFGGEVLTEYNFYQARSMLGTILLKLTGKMPG
jgi:hypothetical protein